MRCFQYDKARKNSKLNPAEFGDYPGRLWGRTPQRSKWSWKSYISRTGGGWVMWRKTFRAHAQHETRGRAVTGVY